MINFKKVGIAAAALATGALIAMGTATSASAQKKITYGEAFKRCKAFMDKEKGGLSGGTTSEQHKMHRGAACMRKFGYRI